MEDCGWNIDEKFLPECSECECPIYDDEYYEVDGDIYCRDCFLDIHKHSTEKYYQTHIEEHELIKKHGLYD